MGGGLLEAIPATLGGKAGSSAHHKNTVAHTARVNNQPLKLEKMCIQIQHKMEPTGDLN